MSLPARNANNGYSDAVTH